VKGTEVTAGLAESNDSLLPGIWRDSLHVTCGLTACTVHRDHRALGPELIPDQLWAQRSVTSMGKLLPFYFRAVAGGVAVVGVAGIYDSEIKLYIMCCEYAENKLQRQ